VIYQTSAVARQRSKCHRVLNSRVLARVLKTGFRVFRVATWIALGEGAGMPVHTSNSLRVVRLSGLSLTEGFSAAKSVAYCFKFRNKIGLDVALEDLKDCLRRKKASTNERSTVTRKFVE